jgi:hypothetical protein
MMGQQSKFHAVGINIPAKDAFVGAKVVSPLSTLD